MYLANRKWPNDFSRWEKKNRYSPYLIKWMPQSGVRTSFCTPIIVTCCVLFHLYRFTADHLNTMLQRFDRQTPHLPRTWMDKQIINKWEQKLDSEIEAFRLILSLLKGTLLFPCCKISRQVKTIMQELPNKIKSLTVRWNPLLFFYGLTFIKK